MDERPQVPDCPLDGQCGPQCEQVFDRVVISHLTTGFTRVMWELLDTFTDPNPLTFQLQAGRTSNLNADDWTDVGLPVTDQYFAYDPEQRVWGMTNWTHYRVKLTSASGVYFSPPMGGMGILDRRHWRLAKEDVRQHLKAFRVGDRGQRGFLLKRRWTGTPCPRCTNYVTQEVEDANCPTCYGTGFQCGYYYPVSCVWAEIEPRGFHQKIDTQARGPTKDVFVKARMLMTDLLGEEDIWVAEKTDDRYYIHEVQHLKEYKGVPISAAVSLRLVPFSSNIYSIEIPQQLIQQGLD